MNNNIETLSISLFSEILTLDQLLRSKIAKGLPKGMELSHFSLLNHLAHIGTERTPADLAKSFNLTRGAISNTLAKLEWAGYVHIRPDWDEARRKQVVISPSGRTARDYAFAQIGPILAAATEASGTEDLKNILPALRRLRTNLGKKI